MAENKKKLGGDWEMFKSKCPECGKTVYVVNPNRSQFCSKQCEANYNYRKRFGGTVQRQSYTPERARKI